MRMLSSVVLLVFFPAILLAQDINISVDTSTKLAPIDDQFSGLSYETRAVLSQDGIHYFRPDNLPLVTLFKTLGIKNLRIGGNTVDDPEVPIPQRSDIDSLFAFAKVADIQVIYSVRLKNGDPQADADIAKYIVSHYAPQLYCMCIGNEPNVYDKQYETYKRDYTRFLDAMTAAAPDAMVCGPSTTPGKVQWVSDFASDFGPGGHIKFLTQHSYPGGSGRKVTDAAAARETMLAGWSKTNEHMFSLIGPISDKWHTPYRLEEANSYFHGGAKDVSNTFASALWGLEYMYWWAAHGAIGVNFHTGDRVASADKSVAAQYAVFTSTISGYAVRPLAYGLLAFNLGGEGNLVAVKTDADPSRLVVYASVSNPDSLFVTIINKNHESDATNLEVAIQTDRPYARGTVVYLKSSDNDLAATNGITLGDKNIDTDGHWNGQWKNVTVKKDNQPVTINIPPASATVVHLSR